MFSTKDTLVATWFVAAPYKDIADVYVNVRDAATNRVLVERHLPYETRSVQLKADELGDAVTLLQLCVQAKNSDGSIGSWFDAQCFAMPADFEAVRSKYSGRFNGVYTMLSSRPPRGGGGRRADRRSGAQRTTTKAVGLLTLSWVVAWMALWIR